MWLAGCCLDCLLLLIYCCGGVAPGGVLLPPGFPPEFPPPGGCAPPEPLSSRAWIPCWIGMVSHSGPCASSWTIWWAASSCRLGPRMQRCPFSWISGCAGNGITMRDRRWWRWRWGRRWSYLTRWNTAWRFTKSGGPLPKATPPGALTTLGLHAVDGVSSSARGSHQLAIDGSRTCLCSCHRVRRTQCGCIVQLILVLFTI